MKRVMLILVLLALWAVGPATFAAQAGPPAGKHESPSLTDDSSLDLLADVSGTLGPEGDPTGGGDGLEDDDDKAPTNVTNSDSSGPQWMERLLALLLKVHMCP